MNPAVTLIAVLVAATRRRFSRTLDNAADLCRHLRGQACQRPVLVHPFVSGARLGFSPERCVWLASESDDWCTRPRRCHFIPEGTVFRVMDAKTDEGRAFISGYRGETGA